MALVTCPTCPCAFRLRRLAQNEKSCQEISYGDLVQNSSEILPRDLLQRSCQQSSYIEFLRRGLARRSWEILRAAILFRDLLCRAWAEILLWDQESFQETSYRDLVQRSCQETCAETLRTDRQEILPRGPLQRSCQETSYRDLARRFNRTLLMETLHGDIA